MVVNSGEMNIEVNGRIIHKVPKNSMVTRLRGVWKIAAPPVPSPGFPTI